MTSPQVMRLRVIVYVAWTRVWVSDAGIYLGVQHLSLKYWGNADMDPNLDTDTGIQDIIIFLKYVFTHVYKLKR